MKVPFHRPATDDQEMKWAIEAVLESRWITQGKMVERLESMVRELTGAKHAVAVNSATTGMMLVARWHRSKCRHENPIVSVPALGGHFASNAVTWGGFNRVRAIDCEDDLTTHWRTGELHVLMDYGGRAADSGKDNPEYSNHLTLCDSAYSLGGTGRDGKPIGTQADAHVFSLQATKQITTGEGGIVTTEIDELAAWLRCARCHGMDADAHTRGAKPYDIVVPGGAFMLPDILAAVGVRQMETREDRQLLRQGIRYEYDHYLGSHGIKWDFNDAHGLHVLRIPTKAGPTTQYNERDEFIGRMSERGVACRIHYPYLPSLTAYKHLADDCPNAKKAASEVVSLPLFDDLKDCEVEYVCKAAKETIAELGD